MLYRLLSAIFVMLVTTVASPAESGSVFDPATRTWTLRSEAAEAIFELTREGWFTFRSFTDYRNQEIWKAPQGARSAPLRIRTSSASLEENTRYRLAGYDRQSFPGGHRIIIDLEDRQRTAGIRFTAEIFDNHAAVRWHSRLRNLRAGPVTVLAADMLSLRLDDREGSFRVFSVNQWAGGGRLQNFETFLHRLDPAGSSNAFYGAGGEKCSWLAFRYASTGAGLFGGLEFNGRATSTVDRSDALKRVDITTEIVDLNRTLQPGQDFQVPAAFFGAFRGDWDEAGYRTQRFVDAMVAKPAPDASFPYVVWNSWRYTQDIDEATLRRNAQIAASLGVELFVVDLGWARQIGDWRPDPRKFPSGMRALSDYVHSLGMKFGMHFAWIQAEVSSPVLRQHADWTSTHGDEYFGAVSLCPAHQPVREWLVREAVRIIDEYNVDWILQDGEGMIKECNKLTHTHDAEDSNYSNAVDGVDALIDEVQSLRPHVPWENCQDGGNMMTYAMTRRYVTSIAADDSGPMTTRQAIHGVTYPFPPRYADRYMPEEVLDTYRTRSYMFGGPWILMNRLSLMRPADLQFLASEIRIYKELRSRIATGKVFHLTPRPEEGRWDALESFDAQSGSALIFVYRAGSPQNSYSVRPRGLSPQRVYHVRSQDTGFLGTFSGRQLMDQGIPVNLPQSHAAAILFIEPAR